ncbi:hypothetical protein CEXT_391961 [Caerostris extrusa]|uniref:Uncharacterized protein n=1 Tax=Caerostris extrusa TaxID=172846 RepID=A0AAV4PAS7_CAEEX|nr:hypothetical protein CEXT_391961 [Caerostris extrusa]
MKLENYQVKLPSRQGFSLLKPRYSIKLLRRLPPDSSHGGHPLHCKSLYNHQQVWSEDIPKKTPVTDESTVPVKIALS